MTKPTSQWWPLCFSESVSSKRPTAVFWGEQELAIYRDSQQQIRAVEDRCPHRRAPLSLGRITPTGHIQCGYHGWTFDGGSGAISGFPNLDAGERLPRCAIQTFPILEQDGLVYISDDANAKPPQPWLSPTSLQQRSAPFCGRTTVALSHPEAVIALLDKPDELLSICSVDILEKTYGNPRIEDGALYSERACRWNLLGESHCYWGPLRHRADYPMLLAIKTALGSGQTNLSLQRASGEEMATMQLTFTPSTRGMTTVHWRATLNTAAWGLTAPLLHLRTHLGRPPLGLRHCMNASALASTLPNVGRDWRTASAAADAINEEALC